MLGKMIKYTFQDILNVIDTNESGTRVWYCEYEVKNELNMRNGIMNRQKEALEKQRREIERLRKEKEWLIIEYTMEWFRHGGYPYLETKEIRAKIIKKMQQALKEGS